MRTVVFNEWFSKVKERPLFFVYNHHLSHVSINVMEIAISGDTTNVKFPPQCDW